MPTAMTLPSCGFSLAVSGMMIPPLGLRFPSRRLTRMRSCSGRTFTLPSPHAGRCGRLAKARSEGCQAEGRRPGQGRFGRCCPSPRCNPIDPAAVETPFELHRASREQATGQALPGLGFFRISSCAGCSRCCRIGRGLVEVRPRGRRRGVAAARAARAHLAFGRGEHVCIGAALARKEAAIAFETLLGRTRDLRLSPAKNDFAHVPNFILRRLKQRRRGRRPCLERLVPVLTGADADRIEHG